MERLEDLMEKQYRVYKKKLRVENLIDRREKYLQKKGKFPMPPNAKDVPLFMEYCLNRIIYAGESKDAKLINLYSLKYGLSSQFSLLQSSIDEEKIFDREYNVNILRNVLIG